MKPIMSFWSEPYIKGFNNKWINDKSWNLSWVLSVAAITKIYGKPYLYTDDAGKYFLADQLGLQFESIDTSLNDLKGHDPRFFSLGRTYSVGIQKEPFIHIDYDSFLFQAIPEECFKNGVLLEKKMQYNVNYKNIICDPRTFKNVKNLPDWWNTNNDYEYSSIGVIGGSNFDYFSKFSELVFSIVNSNDKDSWEDILNAKEKSNLFSPQYTIDQYGSLGLAKSMNVSPRFLISQNNIMSTKYAHASFEKITSSDLYGRMIRRILLDYPDQLNKVSNLDNSSNFKIPKVSVIIIPNENEGTYDTVLKALVPRNTSPDEIFVSEYKLKEEDKKLLSRLDKVRIVPGADSYIESLKTIFKRTRGDLIIVLDGHVKVPSLYIEKSIASYLEYPNSVFCSASKDFSDNDKAICYGGIQDDYGIRPDVSLNKNPIMKTTDISCLYGGFYCFPSNHLRICLDKTSNLNKFSEFSSYLYSKKINIKCITSIEVSSSFKVDTNFRID